MTLSEWLEKNDVKRNDFASRIGVSAPFVTYLCSGEKRPSIEVLHRITEATDGRVTAADFMGAGASSAGATP